MTSVLDLDLDLRDAPAGPTGTAAQRLRVRGVEVALGGVPVLRGADLDVAAGRIVTLLGPSGCGKTTLLRTVAGLQHADAGTVDLGARTVAGPGVDVPAERRSIGMVFQDWALFPHLTVAGNVAFGLRRRERRGSTVDDVLGLVGLRGLADRMPATLSGGQQQRVALARALATRPAAILLDEPFSNLDPVLRSHVRTEVARLLRGLGATALIVTHDQEEAFLLGDEVAVMDGGRVVQQAAPSELYESPATRAVAAFLGDGNLVSGVARGDRAETCWGSVPLRGEVHGEVEVLLRPEHLRVRPGTTAVVADLEYYGHDAVYCVRDRSGAVLRVRVLTRPELRAGDRVDVEYAGGPAVAYPTATSS